MKSWKKRQNFAKNHEPLNQLVTGSIPVAPTNKTPEAINGFRGFSCPVFWNMLDDV